MASPLQAAIYNWGEETFGPENRDSELRLRKLWDEMEELVRAYGSDIDNPKWRLNVQDELADVYLCLLVLAQCLGVDLEKLGQIKMAELKARTYEQVDGQWTKVKGGANGR